MECSSIIVFIGVMTVIIYIFIDSYNKLIKQYYEVKINFYQKLLRETINIITEKEEEKNGRQ